MEKVLLCLKQGEERWDGRGGVRGEIGGNYSAVSEKLDTSVPSGRSCGSIFFCLLCHNLLPVVLQCSMSYYWVDLVFLEGQVEVGGEGKGGVLRCRRRDVTHACLRNNRCWKLTRIGHLVVEGLLSDATQHNACFYVCFWLFMFASERALKNCVLLDTPSIVDAEKHMCQDSKMIRSCSGVVARTHRGYVVPRRLLQSSWG